MQRRRFRDADRVVVDLQPRGTFERQRAAAGARTYDNGLARLQFAGHRRAERLRAVGRSDHVDEFRVPERCIDVVSGIDNVAESGDIAFGVDSTLVGDPGYVVRKIRKVEQPDLMSVRRAVERHRRSAGPCTQYRNLHRLPPAFTLRNLFRHARS